MKTTLGKILTAYNGLTLIRKKVRGTDARDLFQLKRAMQDSIDFLADEEEKLADEHGGKIAENGVVLIVDPKDRAAFNAEIKTLREMETEIQADQMTLPADKYPEITLEEMEMLEEFVTFE